MKTALTVFFLAVSLHGFSQKMVLTDSAKVNSTDLMLSDKGGNIYVTDIRGNLYKFDPKLDSFLVYSPSNPARISSFDPWRELKIFVFYEETQEFTWLNRFLNSLADYKMPAGFIVAATPSFDNKLWLFDQPSMSLIKYDYLNKNTDFRKPLSLVIKKPLAKVSIFREYQNRIYLAGQEGELYVFDNLGNFLFSQPLPPESRWIGFYEENICYIAKGSLFMLDLYSFRTTGKTKLPPFEKINAMIKGDQKIYISTTDAIYLFQWQ